MRIDVRFWLPQFLADHGADGGAGARGVLAEGFGPGAIAGHIGFFTDETEFAAGG
jgi:hypothetical protein